MHNLVHNIGLVAQPIRWSHLVLVLPVRVRCRRTLSSYQVTPARNPALLQLGHIREAAFGHHAEEFDNRLARITS